MCILSYEVDWILHVFYPVKLAASHVRVHGYTILDHFDSFFKKGTVPWKLVISTENWWKMKIHFLKLVDIPSFSGGGGGLCGEVSEIVGFAEIVGFVGLTAGNPKKVSF